MCSKKEITAEYSYVKRSNERTTIMKFMGNIGQRFSRLNYCVEDYIDLNAVLEDLIEHNLIECINPRKFHDEQIYKLTEKGNKVKKLL